MADKLTQSTERLAQSLDKLEKSATAVGTVLSSTALASLVKGIARAIPQATTKLVSELQKSVKELNSTMAQGIGLLRTAFRSLYVQLHQTIQALNSLFATTNQIHLPKYGSKESLFKKIGRTVFGGPESGSTARGRSFPIANGQMVGSVGSQGLQGIAEQLTGIKSALSPTITELLSTGFTSNLRSNDVLAQRLGGTVAQATNVLSVNLLGETQKLGGILRDGFIFLGHGFDRVIAALSAQGGHGRRPGSILEPVFPPPIFGPEHARAAGRLGGGVGGRGGKGGPGWEVIAPILQRMLIDLDKAVSQHSLYVHVKDDPESRAGGGKSKQKEPGKGLGMMGLLGGAAGLAAGGLGLAALTGGALNPGALEQMGLAFKDLTATVGVAFEPALQVVTGVLRQLGAAILPLFVRLRPVITQATEALGRALVPVVRVLASALELLVPFIEPLTAELEGLSDIVVYLSSVAMSFVDVFKETVSDLLGLDFKDAMDSIVSSLQYVGQQLVLTIATIAKKLGYGGFVDKLIKHFEEATKPKMGGATAGGPTSVTTLDAIVKNMATNAGKAGGFGGMSKEEQAQKREEARQKMMQETVEALQEIAKKGETDTLLKSLAAAATIFADGVTEIVNFIEWWKNHPNVGTAKDFFGGIGSSIRSAVGGKNTRIAQGTVLGEVGGDILNMLGL